jgi:hypothetical protein
MSIRRYCGTALDCDGCEKAYTDVCEISVGILERGAKQEGWLIECGNHYCPECRKRATIVLQEEAQPVEKQL